jgi:hypothetical protein
LEIELPDAIGVELETAAKRCGIAPPMWAAQAIESELANQRLPKAAPGCCGARVHEASSEDLLQQTHRVVTPEMA